MKRFNFILSIIILIASAILCQQIITHSSINQKNRSDYFELNSLKYGILNLEKWKQHIVRILLSEINTFDLSEKNEQDLKNKIGDLLKTLIDRVEANIREKYSASAWGRVKLSLLNIFVNMDDIRKGIPQYADAIYNEMITAKTKDQIKLILSREVEKFSRETYDTQDRSRLKRILSETDSRDIETARIKVNNKIADTDKLIFRESLMMIALSVFLFLMSGITSGGIVVLTNSGAGETFHIAVRQRVIELLSASPCNPMPVSAYYLDSTEKAAQAAQAALQDSPDITATAPFLGTYHNDAVAM